MMWRRPLEGGVRGLCFGQNMNIYQLDQNLLVQNVEEAFFLHEWILGNEMGNSVFAVFFRGKVSM